MSEGLVFEKVPVAGVYGAITGYRVLKDGAELGYVWKKRGFSYMGDQGWNAGIRLRDYEPIEWHYAKTLGGANSGKTSSRRYAGERLDRAS